MDAPTLKAVEFKRVNVEVEKELNINPIRIPGIGLTETFHELFDENSAKALKEQTAKMYNSNKKNQQVRIDKHFLKGHTQQKRKAQRLEKDL